MQRWHVQKVKVAPYESNACQRVQSHSALANKVSIQLTFVRNSIIHNILNQEIQKSSIPDIPLMFREMPGGLYTCIVAIMCVKQAPQSCMLNKRRSWLQLWDPTTIVYLTE